jgi:hypothetical protein
MTSLNSLEHVELGLFGLGCKPGIYLAYRDAQVPGDAL